MTSGGKEGPAGKTNLVPWLKAGALSWTDRVLDIDSPPSRKLRPRFVRAHTIVLA
eukprot:CAMPEP_0197433332 /NCGR_PEP_ID=MMETSP1175-20131217/1245_1 /TAXON_ID=1003142 /ORGANISM="Triceratium dubium, Strain CCMP147" /LENGTH=54 /DNA_ID=CAMNT_0042961679 /DNA_START=167 /DNA_END=331 /DNA_ORIENTATION=+